MNKLTNPYTLAFGKEPQNIIERNYQNEDIIEGFLQDNPSYYVCMITGVRGSGKTVALTRIANSIEKEKDWIVVNLNPNRNLLEGLAAELVQRKELKKMFIDAKINLSVLGFGLDVELNKSPLTSNVVVILRKMLLELTKHKHKVLITIDEVRASKNVREFVSQVQIYIREGINIFVLMSGLYNNIEKIQNDKSITFLQRAPKVTLSPLNITMIKESFEKNVGISKDDAYRMAKMTKGYAFAFQLLGYLLCRNNGDIDQTINDFDIYIEEYTYNIIWGECSENEKAFLSALNNETTKIETIKNKTNMSNGSISTYRMRLIKSGIIVSPSYGVVEFALPRFKEFIERVY